MSEPEKICTDIAPLLDAFFDGELNAGERQSVEKHIASCAQCQLKLAEIGRLVNTLRDMPQLQPSRDLAADIPELLAANKTNNLVTLRPRTWASIAVAAAAVLLFIAFKVLNVPAGSPVVAHATQKGKAGVAQVPSSNHMAKPEREFASNGAYQDQQMIHSADIAHTGSRAGAGAGKLHFATRPTEVASNSPQAERQGTASNRGSTAGQKQNMIAENGTNANANQAIKLSGKDDEEATKGNSVEVATLDEVGHSSVTGAIGLSTDEDGLYAIEM